MLGLRNHQNDRKAAEMGSPDEYEIAASRSYGDIKGAA
jgi:hypothetical protein